MRERHTRPDVQTITRLKPYNTLHYSCLEAISAHDRNKLDELLQMRCPHPHYQFRMRKFIPSATCLAEAILEKQLDVVQEWLSFPYFVIPDEGCLAYAIKNQYHDLVDTFVRRYRVKTPSNCTLRYAISACNVKLVKYLLFKRRVPLDEDLLDEIYSDPEDEDDFFPEERRRRNKRIRRILKRVLREEGVL